MMNCLSCAFPGLANLYVVTVLHIEAACDICPMKPQPPSSAQSSRRPSRLDQWTIYLPAEILPAFQTGSRRFEAARPATSETQRFQPSRDRFAAEPSSYFPKIRESAIARDKREKQLVVKQAHQGWNQSTRTCRRRFNSQSLQAASHVPTKSLATLDQDGMAVMRLAFERRGRLDEKDFTAEMLHALNAQELEWEQQVNLIHELSSLYQQSDLHAAGFLTWEDFSSSIFKPSDEHSPEVDTASQRLKCQPDALNMSAELHGMYYFEGIDRVFLNDTRNRGFRLLDPSTNTLVGEFNAPSRGTSILDAVYSPMGRYVITASTSPVITLYDVDQLVIRQQIPTEVAQIALEISLGEATPRLYSSCTNGRIHVWNMETLSNSHSFFMKGHEVMTDIVAIHNTTHIAASCLDGKIYVLDVHLERIGKALTGHDKGVTMLKYCAHKGYLVSGGLDHCLHLWNPHVEQKIGSLKSHKHQLIGLEIVPDSPQVISADESGLVKIWDLRKFAPVRTFKREAYVQDHTLPRTLTIPMRSMCYMPSRKRLAIAHSSVFFVDFGEDVAQTTKVGEAKVPHDNFRDDFDVEERSKPLAVVFHRPSGSVVVITPRELQSWAANSGNLLRREKFTMRVDVTCVSIVEDKYSCIVGTEDGTVARVMLPRGAVIASKRLHTAEVAAVRWVSGSRLVVSSSFDGTVLISQSANLEVLHTLNHWHTIQSVSNNYSKLCDNSTENGDPVLSEPQNTLSKVVGLKKLFNSADYAQTGKITTRKAKELLDRAFPIPHSSQFSSAAKTTFAGREAITLTAFLKKAQLRLRETHEAAVLNRGNAGPDAVTIDVHGELQHLITVSPFDGTFCVWKVKGGTVVATDSLICAATWISDELNDVFCVGDDHGFVTFYEFEGLFKEIDTIRRSLQVASRRKDSYSDQNDVTQLLSPALLQIRYGRCVGDLVDESIPWQLNLTKTETNETSNAAAAKMLQELKSHRRASQTPQRRQSQMKQEWIRSASLSVNAQENIAEGYAKRRPGLSRFLAVAKQL
ncbi:hypothetical protein PF005_g7769 [Phytophthora fragariae]|uniref:Uncharacterized protein n=1 Tax=Phytophthora fragariae TaxID=53985 RepID=A0A6A3UD25_9STRA|nr:hypothetical protein PF007_g8036 [Phytophthora fragariae]KAE9148330.1 hypothetical protein PF006_g7051 [Phytophthora fragariae]KAE9219675.1 hypothetical protein PF005_g7769 [Phytophthora fragariae]